MSKKFKKHRRRGGFPWPMFLFGGLALIAAAIVLSNQGREEAGGTPAIAVDEQHIDYGVVRFGETRAFKIKVSNTGDGTLRFQEKPYVEVLEGC
jgi:hypothetical protein